MAHGVFVTAITCMDGRVQQPVSDWMRATFKADYVDTITEAGPDGLLADDNPAAIESIRHRSEISVKGHGSRVLAIVAHHDCAGNPVQKPQHLAQLERAAAKVHSWGLPAKIVTLWVGEDWQVQPIARID